MYVFAFILLCHCFSAASPFLFCRLIYFLCSCMSLSLALLSFSSFVFFGTPSEVEKKERTRSFYACLSRNAEEQWSIIHVTFLQPRNTSFDNESMLPRGFRLSSRVQMPSRSWYCCWWRWCCCCRCSSSSSAAAAATVDVSVLKRLPLLACSLLLPPLFAWVCLGHRS